MGEVIDIQIERNKREFRKEGLEPDNMLLCFSEKQLSIALTKIFHSKEGATKVLEDNKDLFRVGYYDERTNKILVLNYWGK